MKVPIYGELLLLNGVKNKRFTGQNTNLKKIYSGIIINLRS